VATLPGPSQRRCSRDGRWHPVAGEPAVDARPAPAGEERRTAA
jgi:hypothetical protein